MSNGLSWRLARRGEVTVRRCGPSQARWRRSGVGRARSRREQCWNTPWSWAATNGPDPAARQWRNPVARRRCRPSRIEGWRVPSKPRRETDPSATRRCNPPAPWKAGGAPHCADQLRPSTIVFHGRTVLQDVAQGLKRLAIGDGLALIEPTAFALPDRQQAGRRAVKHFHMGAQRNDAQQLVALPQLGQAAKHDRTIISQYRQGSVVLFWGGFDGRRCDSHVAPFPVATIDHHQRIRSKKLPLGVLQALPKFEVEHGSRFLEPRRNLISGQHFAGHLIDSELVAGQHQRSPLRRLDGIGLLHLPLDGRLLPVALLHFRDCHDPRALVGRLLMEFN